MHPMECAHSAIDDSINMVNGIISHHDVSWKSLFKLVNVLAYELGPAVSSGPSERNKDNRMKQSKQSSRFCSL